MRPGAFRGHAEGCDNGQRSRGELEAVYNESFPSWIYCDGKSVKNSRNETNTLSASRARAQVEDRRPACTPHGWPCGNGNIGA